MGLFGRRRERDAAPVAIADWQPDGTGVQSNGWCGGDIQVGDSYSVRLMRPAVFYDYRWRPALITITFYATEDEENCPGEFGVQRQVEWMICGDLSDPGSTEIWSNEAYDDVNGLVIGSADEAEQEAREWAEYALANAEIYGGWDGQPFST